MHVLCWGSRGISTPGLRDEVLLVDRIGVPRLVCCSGDCREINGEERGESAITWSRSSDGIGENVALSELLEGSGKLEAKREGWRERTGKTVAREDHLGVRQYGCNKVAKLDSGCECRWKWWHYGQDVDSSCSAVGDEGANTRIGDWRGHNLHS